MNKDFQKIKEEKVLFFDSEIVRRSVELELDSTEYSLYQKKTRNRETDEFLSDTDLVAHYNKNAALKLGYNKIVTIGVGFIKGGKPYIKDISGEEGDVIRQFCEIANQFDYICGANILAFDCPMILNNGWRYFNMTTLIKDAFITNGKKPWNLTNVVDLMDQFKGTHYYNNSVEEICYHFGIPSPKDDITGAEVSEVYYYGDKERIYNYVKKDVFANINIFKKMRGEEIFTEFVDRGGVEETTVERTPVLNRIYLNKYITGEDETEIKELLGKKKITKKDKVILIDMIHKISVESDIFKKDSKKVVEEKLEVVTELINNL